MTGTGINIDPDSMKAMVAKAIIEGIDEDQKTVILAQAVEHLLKEPAKQGYSSVQPPSPIQEAFNLAVSAAARDIAREMVQGELKEKINTMVQDKIRDMLNNEGMLARGIGEAIGEAVENAMRKEY